MLGYVGTITDITSRKHIEERQKESERFLKETQLIAKLGTYSFDIITGRWRSSEVLDNIFGIEADYNKNFENWQAIVHPDWRKKMTAYFIDEVIGNKTKFDYEYKIIRINDQAERWVHGIGYLKLNDDNQPISMVGTIRDITEHKQIEIELTIAKELAEESNFKIKNYLENAPDGVFVADEKGNYIEVNPAATLITGYTKEELLKMSVKDLTAPDSLQAAYNHFHILVQVGSSKGDIQYVHKNGDIRWSSVEAVKLSERKFLGFVKDITERKKNEEEIKISNERFELIAKATNDGLWDWDLDADLLWANEIHQQFYGLTMADPVPKSKDWIQRIHPEDRERTVEAFEKAKASDTESHVDEYRFYTENKDWMNVYGRTLIERNIEGKPVRLIGSMMDITERKKTEAAIKASEEKYRQLFENSPMPMWVYEIDSFKILDVNEAAISHYGYTKTEFTSMKVFDLRPAEEVPKFLSANRDLKQGLRNFGVWKHKKKDGTLIDVEVNSHDIDFSQKSSRLVLAYDVTEKMKMQWALAESENRLRTIYNTEPECIKLLGAKGEIIEMNPAGLQIIEADSLEEAKEKSILGIINEPYRKLFQKLIKNVFKGNSGKLEFEITGLKGTIRWLDTHAIPLKDNEGKIISFLGVARDITENKKAQEEIKNTAEQLRQLTAHIQIIREEERKRIGREIHDELGQQLTAIKMDVVWIDKKMLEETSAVKNKLKNIITLLDGSNQSIRRILSELRPVILDDRGLLEAMEWMGNQFTANTGIPVKFSSSETEIKLSEPVATCIFRVYQEAFTNITRHAMAKKVFSSINIIDDTIKVTIKDDGKGFNAESVQNKTKFGILGMKERVLSLNGKFELISYPEKGTEIIIKLPYPNLKNRLLSKK